MLDEKNIGNDSSSLFNGNHFPSYSASEAKLTNRRENCFKFV